MSHLIENCFLKSIKSFVINRYQKRAKVLSEIWRDRPLPPMDTAIFWIEYVAKHKGRVEMKPQSFINTNYFQYYLCDLLLILALIILLLVKVTTFIKSMNQVNIKRKQKKVN